jgi:hypothetical protein
LHPAIEQSLFIEFDELFSLRERLRTVTDNVRARLYGAGLVEPLETDVFERELEMRGVEPSRLLIRLSSYQLEIAGAPAGVPVHVIAAMILEEAGAFRLVSVEAGFALTLVPRPGYRLDLVRHAFTPVDPVGSEPMLDRRFSLTWDWGNPTTGFSFYVSDTEDRELFLSFKARVGYMTLPELQSGRWLAEQAQRFDGLVSRVVGHLGLAP